MPNNNLHDELNQKICEAFGCNAESTSVIKVKVGQRTIALQLCGNCVNKFQNSKEGQSRTKDCERFKRKSLLLFHLMTPPMTMTPTWYHNNPVSIQTDMSGLDDAMMEHLAHIVLIEGRPPCYIDFLCFEAGGKQYKMSRGTFRNKISGMKKLGEVEVAYHSWFINLSSL